MQEKFNHRKKSGKSKKFKLAATTWSDTHDMEMAAATLKESLNISPHT